MKDALDNKVIYITGATAGIGFALAELLLTKGSTVVISGRNNQTLESAQKKLRKLFDQKYLIYDLSNFNA